MAGGDVDRARQLLTELVGVVDAGSEARWIRRCVDVATRIDAPDLALHYALCLWCARPGQPTGRRAVSGAALFHPDRRVSGAGYRVGLDRARASDWQVIAAADAYAAWPGSPRSAPTVSAGRGPCPSSGTPVGCARSVRTGPGRGR